MTSSLPHILVIDDEPAVGSALKSKLQDRAVVTPVHPRDLEDRHLVGKQLVLIDLRITDWDERSSFPLACQPLTGLGLSAVLKDHIIERLRDSRPVAFALHSGHTEDLSRGLPLEERPHVLAAANNLAWVFLKGTTELEHQVLSLASAVGALPTEWDPSDFAAVRAQVERLLGLTETDWSARAWSDVEGCHPPLHSLSQQSHGLAFVRWLLHRILPYPCFLFDARRLAVRFRLDFTQLSGALTERSSGLSRALSPYRYSGIASDFLGERWWGAGIETFAWNTTDGRPFDADLLRARLSALAGRDFASQPCKDAVLCLGADLSMLDSATPLSDAVRIQPDDWPAYADQAWAELSLAKREPRIRALVLTEDRERLEE